MLFRLAVSPTPKTEGVSVSLLLSDTDVPDAEDVLSTKVGSVWISCMAATITPKIVITIKAEIILIAIYAP